MVDCLMCDTRLAIYDEGGMEGKLAFCAPSIHDEQRDPKV
jgi:hypothetical protein